MIVGGQRSYDGLTGVLVVPDGCGQCENPLEHADDHAAGGSTVVTLKVELSFEGLVDRFDDLS
jgi:hypothetical protein